VSYDRQLTPQPRLATSWQWSPDWLRLTLKLRPGVKFHTGRPFTSADARFTLERLRDPAVGSVWRTYANLMHVDTPDDLTLVIDYDAPLRSSFDALAATFIADPQTQDQTSTGQGLIGTGPFRFQEWVPGDHLAVVRNPDYWQPGKPYLDRVELRVMPDQLSALLALQTANVEWVSGVDGQQARSLQSNPAYRVIPTMTGGTFYYVGFDVTVPSLADKRVRQAFNYALNRQAIVDTALNGFGRAASTLWPRQSLGYDAALDQAYPYDLDKARELLTAAGWDPSTTVTMALPGFLPVSALMAQIYQADLARIGVTLTLRQLESGDFFTRLQTGQFGGTWMANMGWMNLSPATFLISALPVRLPNASHFTTPRYQQLLDQVTGATADQQEKVLVHEVTQIMLDESFVIPIAEAAGTVNGPEVIQALVRDVSWDSIGLFAYEDVWLEA
jgi:peptide/nickel transport system substrate-binding protein